MFRRSAHPAVRLSAIAAGGALVLALSGCIVVNPGGGDGDRDDMHDGMGDGMHDQSSEWEDVSRADVMFAQMMIPHHEQAIEMSQFILADDGVRPEVLQLALDIEAAQAPEIELMESWLDEWGVPSMGGDGRGAAGGMGGSGMGGMLSDAEMDELESADGAEAERLYLEGMIEHHEGAIAMAERHQDRGEDDDVLELSASIIVSQAAEIERMEGLLADLD
ncbi:uncharacterized protein (DUF305 family) [Agromyces flavus]|uniref:Uncharacterized conserved protein, DUF305 family n=1 Tax=Agromyces flavus TaxID=589382 RepID=A0A1H1ZRM8_9MICO|nr:DUF305 domain-containing protein [Agromyces flavus]MCP2367210.1 uncharacterized protein (DUF305 family) [Agromyces flavus]GGI46183.1 hypothetical protein GCM10010932_13320 [Agromyces flavus]SDT35916.1 Uncharacterized conserved protein, DUF305 family [Agromyces flavus]